MSGVLKEFGISLLFIAVMPFLILFVLIGFRHCWQCHHLTHLFTSKKYEMWPKANERVCKGCYKLLTESR